MQARVRDPGAATTALVLGNYPPTLAVIRALARRGVRVVQGYHGAQAGPPKSWPGTPEGYRWPYPCFSRHVRETFVHPPVDPNAPGTFEPFVDAVAGLLSRRPEIGWVYPVGDPEILALAAYADRLPADVVPVMAPPEVVSTCVTKATLLATARDAGLPVPPFGVARSLPDLEEVVARVGYPCIAKADRIGELIRGDKAAILRGPQDVARAFPAWPDDLTVAVVQRYVPGVRHNLYFVAAEGRLLDGVEVRILRTDRSNGTGYAVDGVSVDPSPAVRAHTAALVEAVGYHGVGCTQFLVDGDAGDVRFLEMNTRLGANVAVAGHCGLDLPGLFFDVSTHPALRRAPIPPRPGQRYAWSYGDAQAIAEAGLVEGLRLRGGLRSAAARLAEVGGTLLGADFHVTWDWRDPLPTLVQYGRFLAEQAALRVPHRALAKAPE